MNMEWKRHQRLESVAWLTFGDKLMANSMETTTIYWGYIGIMENEKETALVYWGYIGSPQVQWQCNGNLRGNA